MSMPGWYPDPGGAQGRFRYWNGASWSSETTGDPQRTPAPSGGTPNGPFGPGTNGGGSGRGLGPLIVGIVAVVLLALGLWWFVLRPNGSTASAPEDTNTTKPSVSAWNETSSPTPSPSASASDPQPSNAQMTQCPDNGGSTVALGPNGVEGGGLAADLVPGWTDGQSSFDMRWAYDTESQVSTVMQSKGGTWFSVVSLSLVQKADGFTSVQQAARGVMSCFATSSYYAGFTGRTDVMAKTVTISGHPGYRLRSEVHVSDTTFPGIAGDVVDVIVVDTGQAAGFGLFVSSYTIGDATRQPLVDACIASLRAS